ncbi:LytR/AlgR family response regulator transcription factor [Alkalihalobacterium chitinilyticum]|uniref:LytTR family DNA-binding domain-containing protein n=1 Tax=Alkalihalobacterium chitinilyticum TaxID=2980103 RepID=A0ABT5VFH3_9BACI|nr:LytTR family DNA-binding domain-containing protein [Alkalihalobacterium chitinilyticum]MDE5413457.1 LytTR family DNA-binding domain-containing protein [Alkalihalobacterium chitinilyticum]
MNRKMKTIIIDDEPLSRDELKFLLESFNDIEIIAEADSGEKGLELIMTKEPDIVFIDIEMPQMSGLDLARAIQNMKKTPLIIFATAYPNYAAKAFRVDAVDYLLKPFDEEQLFETMTRVKERLKQEDKMDQLSPIARLAVEDEGRIVYLSPSDIVYLYREERETIICTKERRFSLKTPIKELEEKLKGYPFFRTHKSYLVNLDKIEELIPWFNGAYQLKVEGKQDEIPVSRNYVKSLRERLEL